MALVGVALAAHNADVARAAAGRDEPAEFIEPVLPLLRRAQVTDDDRVEAPLSPETGDIRIARHSTEAVAEEAIRDAGVLDGFTQPVLIEVVHPAARLAAHV